MTVNIVNIVNKKMKNINKVKEKYKYRILANNQIKRKRK